MTARGSGQDELPPADRAGGLLPIEAQLDLVDAVQRLRDARRALQSALYDLAVDLAVAGAAYDVSHAQLASATGLERRAVRRLVRMSVH